MESTVVVGAGPAGLTAAYELVRRGRPCEVFEADRVVGGISRTEERDGWRFDIGGHRFFTKVPRVEELWHELLDERDFPLRPRMSRIHYRGRFYDYPLKASNALVNLGLVEAVRCVGSYVRARVRPPADLSTFEGWVTARFGRRLYGIFFKTYTEKVWGVPADTIQADWAAQRIKDLSLGRAVADALTPGRRKKEITSLIEEFRYPRLGPGMMWESCADRVRERGGAVHLGTRVESVRRHGDRLAVTVRTEGVHEDTVREVLCDHLISSMPLGALIRAFGPDMPDIVAEAAAGLRHRDFLTVALVVPERFSFPDNWIYIHSPEVRLGRVQNYGSWSADLVRAGRTCLGLEYFVTEGDDLWRMPDDDLVAFGTRELERLGLVASGAVERGYVVRVPKAYPVYDAGHAHNVEVIRKYLDVEWPRIHPVGRNGMHRYNNQDHSMLTAMLTVENIVEGARHDVWRVNVDADYHEESAARAPGRGSGGKPGTDSGRASGKGSGRGSGGGSSGTSGGGSGRDAPVLREVPAASRR